MSSRNVVSADDVCLDIPGWAFRLKQGMSVYVLFVGIESFEDAEAAALDAFAEGQIEAFSILSPKLADLMRIHEGRFVKMLLVQDAVLPVRQHQNRAQPNFGRAEAPFIKTINSTTPR